MSNSVLHGHQHLNRVSQRGNTKIIGVEPSGAPAMKRSLEKGEIITLDEIDKFVDGASAIAKRLGISDIVIGLTIVSWGTSAPELAVSLNASFNGQGDMTLGNIVGSNVFNIGMVLGLCAMFLAALVRGRWQGEKRQPAPTKRDRQTDEKENSTTTVRLCVRCTMGRCA